MVFSLLNQCIQRMLPLRIVTQICRQHLEQLTLLSSEKMVVTSVLLFLTDANFLIAAIISASMAREVVLSWQLQPCLQFSLSLSLSLSLSACRAHQSTVSHTVPSRECCINYYSQCIVVIDAWCADQHTAHINSSDADVGVN